MVVVFDLLLRKRNDRSYLFGDNYSAMRLLRRFATRNDCMVVGASCLGGRKDSLDDSQ
jgi:hypothetical protein